MFLKPVPTAPARAAVLLKAAETAGRAVPPAFPLDATVAVNPMLGQTSEDLATAAARLARVAGVALTRPRAAARADLTAGRITEDDLAAARAACPHVHAPDLPALLATVQQDARAPRALPTVADLAAAATGTDWPALIARTFGLWAAGRFDRGQALWTPAPGQSAFAAWRDWATHDLTPEIGGLTGFCAHVAQCPDTANRAILRASDRLGLPDAAAPTVFHRLLADLGGWAQHARWLLWQAELQGATDTTLTDLLAIRLVWEEALFDHAPQVAAAWAAARDAHAEPVAPSSDQIADAIWQEAAERAHQRRLSAALAGAVPAAGSRPALQAAFCIDVRSEVFRRALESLSPEIETVGFAGFFGLPVAHRAAGSTRTDSHLPVLLTPAVTAQADLPPDAEETGRIAARATRAWGRFRQAAVSSFAFVEAAGPLYGAKLVKDALGRGPGTAPAPAPRFDPPLSADAKATTAAAVLTAMGMTRGHAPLVLLLGHGAQVTNNPHESGYHCGACGGQTGEVSARLLAGLLNDPETRAGLAARGMPLPGDTVFVAGLHDTTTDAITLHDAPALPRVRDWLAQAGVLTRAERALRLPGAPPAARARNWAEVRPEWGLAGCAAFIAAPRAATRGRDLGGRAFLHSYDWQGDAGFATLELILTAPVVVASWISLQYYGSTVAPAAFGGGNKLIHNVTGGIGVVEGNGGTLRPGLPWQAVHDGDGPAHDPLRLTVMVEAPQDAIAAILSRHDGVRALFDNGWLHLIALDGGRPAGRYRPGLRWEEV
jgi:uncharacterized protein